MSGLIIERTEEGELRIGFGMFGVELSAEGEAMLRKWLAENPPEGMQENAAEANSIDVNRVCEWVLDQTRKPAELAFTAGAERKIADLLLVQVQRAERAERQLAEAGRAWWGRTSFSNIDTHLVMVLDKLPKPEAT